MFHLRRHWWLTVLLLAGGLLIGLGGGSAGAVPVLAGSTVVTGPDPGIVALRGMSIARDGTGGVVYLDQVAGVAHVFVSRLAGGIFRAPQRIDATLPGPSSQPVIAAGRSGVLLVAFINGGQLYVVTLAAGASGFGASAALAAGAANPSISMSDYGKAYLAFTALGAGGHDVRAAYYFAGRWGLEPTPLDAVAGDDAGTATGRPAVVAAGDGVGIVTWGEAGHIFVRRVWGTAPSVVYQQADVPTVSGWNEVSAAAPSVGAGADSSYIDIGFQESVTNGGQTQNRVLVTRLIAGITGGTVAADGLTTPGPEGAVGPQVVMDDSGRGYVTSARTASDQLTAEVLGNTGVNGAVLRVDSLPNTLAPDAAPSIAGLISMLIGWQEAPSAGGPSEIRVRYAPTGGASLGPELVASSPFFGSTNADAGLFTGGDVAGDAALAWVQGSGRSTRIMAAQMYQPPGSFAARAPILYTRNPQPTLSWTAARESWGPLLYAVTLDGVTVARTGASSYRPPAHLAEGPHVYQVTASNPAGVAHADKAATEFVDTIAPSVSIGLSGHRRVGSPVRLRVRDTDVRPPEPAADSSGAASVVVRWGDGHRATIGPSKFHVYRRPGRYKVAVTVTDRAGNKTTVLGFLRIVRAKPARPKQKRGTARPRHGPRR